MRFLETLIRRDLEKKMVFVGGPRQVGKTTLVKHLLANHGPGRYFDWDYDEDRQSILRKQWARADRLLVFDELHKFPQWKRWVKGLYDVAGDRHRILVTGSARLDVYRQGGDSLLGRYHYWRLHPFSLDEIPAGIDPPEALRRLMADGLVTEGTDGYLHVMPPTQAAAHLDAKWDRFLDELPDPQSAEGFEFEGMIGKDPQAPRKEMASSPGAASASIFD